jgi:asparagine synthase (glutamine-hydrolysing)
VCGIAGFVGKGDQATLAAMCDAIEHRGPDGRGSFADSLRRVYLGHLRLAILDLECGAQPMWNETESVCVVFNGEIYNHRELRGELTSLGHRFASDHSDTEVLVHGYEEWGEDLPGRLNGMFAFAIYDLATGRLFLARDRFGEKPLFYVSIPGFFAFGSELSAVLAHPATPREVDSAALRKYYAHCYFPSPHTPYRAIRKLPGGHCLTMDVRSGAVRIREYWRFDIPAEPQAGNEDELAEELRFLVSQAVKRRLESDVPLGILLSGGVDSSAILACAANYADAASLRTFCIGFNEPSFDESGYAQTMADFIGANHRTELCDLEKARLSLPAILRKIGEPIGDPSLLPTYLVSAFARKHVKVALSGDGGDELFAGYDPFKALAPSYLYQALTPRKLHPALQRLAGCLPLSDRNMSLDFKLRRWLRGVAYPPALWNPIWMGALAPDEIAELFGTEIKTEDLYSEVLTAWEQCESKDLLDRSLVYFTRFYLQDDILVKTDRASMQFALELRTPFLDNDVVEFARRLPRWMKMHKGQRKYLLKRAFQSALPAETLHRRKKGFGIPLARWLRELPVPADMDTTPGLDPGAMRQLWERHRTRRQDNRLALWCGLTLHYGLAGASSSGPSQPACPETAVHSASGRWQETTEDAQP